jgi:Carboxypeptidase regulatory-like domain/TonB-dependent Receptor Plug Domain
MNGLTKAQVEVAMQNQIRAMFRGCCLIAFVALASFSLPSLFAQTATTGSINGFVTDTTGAAVPNATISVKDTQTDATIVLVSNGEGRFTAPFLKPDSYELTASAPGLQSTTTKLQVLTGQQLAVNITVAPAATAQTVEVVANNAQLIDTQSSNTTTTFTTQQFEELPTPGGDITTIAFTVPGVVMGAGTQGFGEIVSDGLPGLSNLVVINGLDYNVSLYGGLNFSGSSNLTLGQQEIEEASMVQNGYSVQYGRQAGVIETFTTKGGSNHFHGLAQWQYNSDGLNANDFFNNQSGVPRSKAVSNQYAAQIGGPILRNRLFFFADTEGIRYVQPSTGFVNLPSPALQASVLANPNLTADSKALYAAMFAGTNSSSAYKNAAPVVTGGGPLQDSSGNYGCGALGGTQDYATGGTLGTSAAESCIDAGFVNVGALNREWLATGRLDWNINDKHMIYFRVTDDQGSQPSFVSLINPTWNQVSIQPSYTGQLNDRYVFSTNVINELIVGALYSSSIFEPANLNAGLASSPTEFDQAADGGTNTFAGVGQSTFFTASTTLGSPWVDFPGGTNSTQYQILDDLSWTKGKHNVKFGLDFLRYDMTDVSLLTDAYGGDFVFGGMADEFGGELPGPVGSFFTQSYPFFGNIHSAVYNMGLYAQDEWHVQPRLVLDFGVRVDRNGDPTCQENCYSRYEGGFPAASATLNTPYNSTISAGKNTFVSQMEAAVVQPRGGFNLDLFGNGKMVLRGGVGLFSDDFPGLILEQAYLSFPNRYDAHVGVGTVGTGAGSAKAIAAASAAAVHTGFSQGQSFNQISTSLTAQGSQFVPPSYVTAPNEFHSPRYVEYSLQLESQLTRADAVILTFAGNHGYDLYISNPDLNLSLQDTSYGPFGFAGLPATSPDPRFGGVTTFSNNAISNYAGGSVQYKHIARGGLTTDISYTYSHSLDDISNGGNPQLPYNGNVTIPYQITPGLPSTLMYSNSDYDIRHNFVLDLVYAEPFKFGNRVLNAVAGGWTASAKSFWRSGEPFSVLNADAASALQAGQTSSAATMFVLADVLNNNFNHHCNSYSNPCLQQAGLFNGAGAGDAGPGVVVQTNFGNVPRNSVYGPHYADVDTALYKDLFKRENMTFQIGAQAYNTFNHVNFGQPADDASSSTLGKISTDINAPTSPYGSSQESTVSGRVLVVQGRFVF